MPVIERPPTDSTSSRIPSRGQRLRAVERARHRGIDEHDRGVDRLEPAVGEPGLTAVLVLHLDVVGVKRHVATGLRHP